MGFDSESSCEETDAIKVEPNDDEYVEPTTDDNDSTNKQDEKTHMCEYEGCNKKFSRPSKLQAHLCYHTGERAYKCTHEGCNKSYSRPQHLRRHIATSHSELKIKKLIRCHYPGCMKELSNQQNLKKHYYRKHERKYPFTCEYCDKGFPKHQQLTQHLFQHTGIPPFRCSECNVGFTKIGDLNRHNRGHKTYKCTFEGCGVVLKAWTHMRTHIKLKHPSEFPCDDCGLTFRTKSRLKMHTTIHKEPHEREIFACTYANCPRFYFKKSNLTHHIKSSHEGKKFECTYEDCNRQLSSKQKLEEHMKLHKTNRPTPRRKKKSRKKRSDTGTYKRSLAVKLSGLKIPYQAEKKLINNESDILNIINIEPSTSHTPITFEKKNDNNMIEDENVQSESSETNKNRFSEDTENSVTETVVPENEYCIETVTSVSCAHDFTNSVQTSSMKEVEPKFKDKINKFNNIQPSASHTVVTLVNQDNAMTVDEHVQNKLLTKTNDNMFSGRDIENSVEESAVTEKEQTHCNETVVSVNSTHEVTCSLKEIESEFNETNKLNNLQPSRSRIPVTLEKEDVIIVIDEHVPNELLTETDANKFSEEDIENFVNETVASVSCDNKLELNVKIKKFNNNHQSHTSNTVVAFVKENNIIMDESLQNELVSETEENGFSDGNTENSDREISIIEKEHTHCSEIVTAENCADVFTSSVQKSPIILFESGFKDKTYMSPVALEKEEIILIINENFQNESLNETDENRFSEGSDENSYRETVVTVKEQAVTSVNCTHDLINSVKKSHMKEIESDKTDNESNRFSSKTEIILTVPFDQVNKRNVSDLTSEQKDMMEYNNSNNSKFLNSNENVNISSISDENCDVSVILDKNVNIFVNPDESFSSSLNLDEISNISLLDLNVEPLVNCDGLSVLNVPLEDDIYSAVMCINSDHGTLLQEVDASSADKRKSKCIMEDSKLQQSPSDGHSERETIEREYEKSSDSTETKLCSPLKDRIQANSFNKASRSVKRRVVSNRKVLANFKKLKTAEMNAKNSSTPNIPDDVNEDEDRINLFNYMFTQKESHMALDSIYREDKYIQDCLRVIDTRDTNLLEEKCNVSDGDSESDESQNVSNNRHVRVTEVGKNISGILDTSSSLKQQLILKRKQKSLDQIVHSLHSVLENKLSGNNPSSSNIVKSDQIIIETEENIKNKRIKAIFNKTCEESSNALSLLSEQDEFSEVDSKSSDCSIPGVDDNLRELCALSQKALLKRTGDHPRTPSALREDFQLGYIKKEAKRKHRIQEGMTIKECLQLLQMTMEDIFPFLKANSR